MQECVHTHTHMYIYVWNHDSPHRVPAKCLERLETRETLKSLPKIDSLNCNTGLKIMTCRICRATDWMDIGWAEVTLSPSLKLYNQIVIFWTVKQAQEVLSPYIYLSYWEDLEVIFTCHLEKPRYFISSFFP